jgi:uncharacterized NAD(P)/FAD-binding protein YdhS
VSTVLPAMTTPFDAAIVGGGFSGLATTLHLQRRRAGARVAWIRGRTPGYGVAYRTPDPAHLLNVRAERMSAWAEFGDDFVNWLYRRHPGHYSAADFVPRAVYAQYLADLDAGLPDSVRRHAVDAVAARFDGHWRVALDDGTEIAARHLVVATGNPRMRDLRWPEVPGLVADFWAWRLAPGWRMPALRHDERAVIVGSGLTAVDAAITLIDAGFDGAIVAISPSGRLPQRHSPTPPLPAFPALDRLRAAPSPSRYLRVLRELAERHPWRQVIDALRCHTTLLWQALDVERQRSFLRHAAASWNQHRHRIAPDAEARLRAHPRFVLRAGRVSGANPSGVIWRPRGNDAREFLPAALVLNCSGPSYADGLLDQPLLQSLIAVGALRPHALGIGICSPSTPGLHALGPLLFGERLETTAVPELRQQADAIALRIARDLDRV